MTPAKAPEPATPRSPSLAAHAQISTQALPQDQAAAAEDPEAGAIFGTVSPADMLIRVRDALLRGTAANAASVAVTLETDNIRVLGLEVGEDRIKRLGRWDVQILPGKDVAPVKRVIEVVADE